MNPRRPRFLIPLAALLVSACEAIGEDPSPVTPQRPTFSFDTKTTAVKTVEIEAGLLVDPDDLTDTPTVAKYGYTENTEVFFEISPYKEIDQAGADDEGFGDFELGVRHRFYENEKTDSSAALRVATKLPTADEDRGLGSGEIDFFVGGSYLRQLENLEVTGYYELGVIGDPGENDVDLQHALALQGVLGLTDQVSAFAELAGIYFTEGPDQLFTTWGGTYAIADSLVLDAAIVVGINDDAPEFQLLGGFTTNLGPIFD